VFFAGGSDEQGSASNKVDIYDMSTNSWSTVLLNQPRYGLTATTAGNKVYFAGGTNAAGTSTNVIDIYDGLSGKWTVSTMSTSKASHAAIAVQNKIYWAGGNDGTGPVCKVEVKDLNTQTTSFTNLFQPTSNLSQWAFEKNNKIVFFSPATYWKSDKPSYFDIYDISTNSWSIGSLSHGGQGPVIAKDNIIYVADFAVGLPQIFKLEF
jgi:hypothetical protein